MARKRALEPGPGLFGEVEPAPRPPAAARHRLYCRVALNRPVRTEFTYGVPEEEAAEVVPGVRVQVPFGRRSEIGVVVGVETETEVDPRRLKGIERVLDEAPLVDASLLALTRWIAETYACAWGEALGAVLPAPLRSGRASRTVLVARVAEGVGETELAELDGRFPKQHRLLRTLLSASGPLELRDVLKRLNLSESPARTLAKRGWITLVHERARPDALAEGRAERVRPEELTDAQALAVASVEQALDAGLHRAYLLQGVTGSGKTEVYLRAIERARAHGKGAIVLVPEIALTPQTVGWFRSRFGDVAVLHSRMTDAQRLDMWLRVQRGEANVVVGARSAIFAPVRDLGVVVVDEEHEPSFKQQNVPRYHARDVAVERARRAGAVCLLGSATPALETWHAAREGRLRLLRLPGRVRGAAPPRVDIVDMRTEAGPGKERGRAPSLFSRKLVHELQQTVERGEQAILFLNRRGHTRVLYCPVCKETVRCGSCDASLTFHRRIDRVVCHLCCEEAPPPRACPTCSAPGLHPLGAGIERVEVEVKRLLPEARVRRMDSDTMVRFEDYTETLEAFGSGEIDVLVGTQMIAKGLDFPRVTLVGIVGADGPLHLPDFRAAERTHQLVSQVAGRAGRGDLPGRIFVQSLLPDHPALVQAARHDFDAFASAESATRLELGYPPFGRLLRVLFEGPRAEAVAGAASQCVEALRAELGPEGPRVLGPAPAPIALVRGRHRVHFMVKAADEAGLDRARRWLLAAAAPPADVRRSLDVDPVNVL